MFMKDSCMISNGTIKLLKTYVTKRRKKEKIPTKKIEKVDIYIYNAKK